MSNSKIKSLSDRMKDYEDVSNVKLTKRTPVIVRIDGKAFHTYTRGLDKPFDEILAKAMQYVCEKLVKDVQGCKLAYTQSDEISLLLTDWEKLTTDSYFDYRLQKIASVVASTATMYFNQYVTSMIMYLLDMPRVCDSVKMFDGVEFSENILNVWVKKMGTAIFDARAFNLPKEEVCNYFLWRQQDATRNSIQSLGQSKFSQKQLDKKSTSDIQEMLFQEYGINWNDIDTKWKRGFCVCKNNTIDVDTEIPIFSQDRNYIEKFLEVEDEE